jgi:multisubunit Na+/H+ antiporter MnhE subunit
MNLKIKALVHTVGLIVGTIAVSLGLNYIGSLLTRDQVNWILASVLCGLFIYLVYGIMLSRLQYRATLEKMNQPVGE